MGGGQEAVGDIRAGGASSLLLRLLLGSVPPALIKQTSEVSGCQEGGRGCPPKQSTACGGVAGRAGRGVRGELRDGQQGTWQEDLAGNGDLRSTASVPGPKPCP